GSRGWRIATVARFLSGRRGTPYHQRLEQLLRGEPYNRCFYAGHRAKERIFVLVDRSGRGPEARSTSHRRIKRLRSALLDARWPNPFCFGRGGQLRNLEHQAGRLRQETIEPERDVSDGLARWTSNLLFIRAGSGRARPHLVANGE